MTNLCIVNGSFTVFVLLYGHLKSRHPRRRLVPPSTNVWQSLTQEETKLCDVPFPMIPTPPFSHQLKALDAKFKSTSNRAAPCISKELHRILENSFNVETKQCFVTRGITNTNIKRSHKLRTEQNYLRPSSVRNVRG